MSVLAWGTSREGLFVGLSFALAACSSAGGPSGPSLHSAAGGSGGVDSPLAHGGHGAVDFGFGGGDGVDTCEVTPDGSDGVVPICDEVAPPNSFTPLTQWTWTAPPPSGSPFLTGSIVTPLVGNFTDDDNSGSIDLCDTPDIVVNVIDDIDLTGWSTWTGYLFLLSGDTGQLHQKSPHPVDASATPAIGDIDGDGVVEVVITSPDKRLLAFEHDGTLKWQGDHTGIGESLGNTTCPTISLYDLDQDGDVEIVASFEVFDHQGHRLWGDPGNGAAFDDEYWCVTPTAADLDGDGDLEVLFGHATYHHDGALWWETGESPSHPHVADFDDDDHPEVFLTNRNGLSIREHDGTLKFGPLRPTGELAAAECWGKPAVVRDFDGDGLADIASSTCTRYAVYGVTNDTLVTYWQNEVEDISGLATATAFDFLGDATSEAIYADEFQLYVYDGVTGSVQLTSARNSNTLIEYPVVADVDNDGSAEIVVVSNHGPQSPGGPTVTVLADAMDRWIPARRIWNQHAYHVSNIREDGTIPITMKKSWRNLNTFRANAQISIAGDCDPEPPK